MTLRKYYPFLFFAVISTSQAWGQISYSKNLQDLKEQRDKAVAAAVDPINRKYQTALEQLKDKATLNKDLESALKIREELRILSTNGTASAALTPKSKTGEDLVGRLPGTSWFWGADQSMKFKFLPNGHFDGHFKGATWQALSPEIIFYTWGGNSFSGVMRVDKGFERLDAAEWVPGKPGNNAVSVTKASR